MSDGGTRAALTGLAALLAGALASAPACSSEDAAQGVCSPGQTQVCVGPGACVGAQECSGDGKSWSACDCGKADAATDGSGGAAGGGDGGAANAGAAGQGGLAGGGVAGEGGAGTSGSAGAGGAGAGGDGGAGGSASGCSPPSCSGCASCFEQCVCGGGDPAGVCLPACSGTGGTGGSGGSGGTGGTGATGGGGSGGCSAPSCSACADCFSLCLCTTGDGPACLVACSGAGGAGGSGGTGGSGGSGGTGGTGGSGGTGGTGGSGGSGGTGGTGGSGGTGGTGGGDGASCVGLPLDCGPSGNMSCCDRKTIGTSFPMGRSDFGTDAYQWGNCEEQPEHTANVSSFSLDTFEVTVGRFRKFASAFATGWRPAPGAGAHPDIASSGWQAAWDASLPASGSELSANLACGSWPIWTPAVGPYELHPINCADWYVSFAFCIWDGGRLPTEAEWELAAASDENRLYPWGAAAIDDSYTAFNCAHGGSPSVCTLEDIAPVGSYPTGIGKYGHYDLVGNVAEWVLDYFSWSWYAGTAGGSCLTAPAPPCNDCANLTPATDRGIRGCGFADWPVNCRSAYRGFNDPKALLNDGGVRCAHDP
jgi:formylglycine-generating enzyme required for sulfatase activity